MKTFAELLSQHMSRAGISDAELARTLGVRRQTIFRWREGLTQRPRSREDVLRIAHKLRLTDVERDELLLAAGFHPAGEATRRTDATVRLSDQVLGQALEGTARPEALAAPSRRRELWGAIVLLVGLGAVVLLIVMLRGLEQGDALLTPVLPEPAVGDEALILIGQFANYGGGQVGYNVAGRLQETLQAEMKTLQLANGRVATWPQVILDREAAVAAGQTLSATLVIWGEYDSGRVVTSIVAPAATAQDERGLTRLLNSPGELNVLINTALPQEMRWMGLYALGEALYGSGRYEQARPVLERALADAPADSGATAGIYFALGVIEGSQPVPDLSQAIAYYTLASEQLPGFVSALNNRGVAYLKRGAEGDRQRAIDDLRRVTELNPDSASGHFNLGMALLGWGEAGRAEALASLQRAHSLAPQASGPSNALCWTYGLLDRAQEALAFCDQAVALDPTGLSRDSRGLVLAMLGRYEEAIAEFESFLAWLDTRPEAEQARYRSSRTAWIAALKMGQNPFDAQTREQLLAE